MKPPQLHSAMTLKEAAAWLTHSTDTQWNAASVLHRLYSYNSTSKTGNILPVLLKVVAPKGFRYSLLYDNEKTLSLEAPQTFILREKIYEFLCTLHESGHATPQELRSIGYEICTAHVPLDAGSLRLSREQVESLLPTFFRLVREINSGEVQIDLEMQIRESDEHIKGFRKEHPPFDTKPRRRGRPKSPNSLALRADELQFDADQILREMGYLPVKTLAKKLSITEKWKGFKDVTLVKYIRAGKPKKQKNFSYNP